jgi:hypothetical protein
MSASGLILLGKVNFVSKLRRLRAAQRTNCDLCVRDRLLLFNNAG